MPSLFSVVSTRRPWITLLGPGTLLLMLGTLSCSGGGSDPAVPPTTPATPQAPAAPALADQSWKGGASSLFGLIHGTVAPDGTVTVTPPREAKAVGNIYDVD
ncbi:MAG: hypothetical protein ABI743_06555, partial [bacterium]